MKKKFVYKNTFLNLIGSAAFFFKFDLNEIIDMGQDVKSRKNVSKMTVRKSRFLSPCKK